MLDAKALKTAAFTALVALMFFLPFGLVKLVNFWPFYLLIALSASAWALYLVYVCERFTLYMMSVIFSFFGIFTAFICLIAHSLVANAWGATNIGSLAVGLGPAAIVLSAYLYITCTKALLDPFDCQGNKIQLRSVNNTKSTADRYPIGLLAGLCTLAASLFVKAVGHTTSGIIGIAVLMFCTLTLLIKSRHVIRRLRSLRMQEKTMPTPYTFMQIDDIREARSRWWISRFFKWLVSWYKSPSA